MIGMCCLVFLSSDGLLDMKISFSIQEMDIPDVNENLIRSIVYIMVVLFWPLFIADLGKGR